MKRHTMETSMLLALIISAGLVSAQTATPTFESAVTTGMVGFAPSTQTAQLNVLNVSNAPATTTATACPVDLEFRDPQNNVLKSLQVSNLAPGTAASLTYKITDLTPGTLVFRTDIRGVVKSNPIVTGPIAAGMATMFPFSICAFLTTLEVFDNTTGVTQTFTSDARSFGTPVVVPLGLTH